MGADASLGVPTPERRQWLVAQLRVLIEKRGPETFLGAPLLEPTPAFFPDPWQRDVGGASVIAQRLLDYARLEHLGLDLEPFRDGRLSEEEPRYVVGFFRGIENAVCRFGIHVPALDDPEYLAGVMAHEVAHAYRAHHGLVQEQHELEEQLTDLTTVFLGSGCLTANLAERVVVERSPEYVSVQRSAGGYLSVEDFAFLMALQLRARGAVPRDVERLQKFLGRGQVYCLKRALQSLEEPLPWLTLRAELGISESGSAEGFTQAPPRAPAVLPGFNEPWGRTTFATHRSRAVSMSALGFCAGLLVGGIFVRVRYGEPLFIGTSIGGLLGALLGHRLGAVRCADAECRAAIPRGARECPGCKRYLLGTLRFPPPRFNEGSNRRRRVRRLVGYRTASFASWGAVLAGYVSLLFIGLGGSMAWVWIMLPSAVVGAAIGRRIRQDLCGGRRCEAVVEDFVRVCPRCLAELSGEAHSRLELL
jgi:hypothetical protein